MAGAVCERESGHPGPHCTRHLTPEPAMWSTDGSRIVSEDGKRLVTATDLTDSDGTMWDFTPPVGRV